MTTIIEVSAWKNSSNLNDHTGSGYGIRISKDNYKDLEKWEEIIVDGEVNSVFRGKRPFTKKCPEIRSQIIGLFFIREKLIKKWEKGGPPKLKLHLVKKGIWKLKL